MVSGSGTFDGDMSTGLRSYSKTEHLHRHSYRDIILRYIINDVANQIINKINKPSMITPEMVDKHHPQIITLIYTYIVHIIGFKLRFPRLCFLDLRFGDQT